MERFDPHARNVLGGPLEICSRDPMTGWFRNGCCETEGHDRGMHIVCAQVTDAFLAHQLDGGNDLITPRPDFGFVGLKAGDHWCVCLTRWKDALDNGVAPMIKLEATYEEALAVVPLEILQAYGIT